MKIKNIVSFSLGVILLCGGIYALVASGFWGLVPGLIGAALAVLGWLGGRVPLIIFGHTCIVVGAFLLTWGITLLPYSEPTLVGILTRPLFWGIISILGGICANYHGFCRCILNKTPENLREHGK